MKFSEGLFTKDQLNDDTNGRLYDDNGLLKFKGRFIEGQKNMWGREYYPDSKLKSKAYYIDDQ